MPISAADDEARGDACQAGRGLLPQRAVLGELDRLQDHLPRRREQHRVQQLGRERRARSGTGCRSPAGRCQACARTRRASVRALHGDRDLVADHARAPGDRPRRSGRGCGRARSSLKVTGTMPLSLEAGPACITPIRSARMIASSMSWVMNSTVLRRRAPDPLQLALHVGAGVRVERGERLVHQQHLRLVGEHARDLDALLHAAGQLGRDACGPGPSARPARDSAAPVARARRAARRACAGRTRRCPAPTASGSSESSPWKTTPRSAAGPAIGLPAIADVARARRLEARHHVEHGGLAAAAGAQQAEELAGLDVEREVADGNVIAALHRAIDLADLRELNERHGPALPRRPRRLEKAHVFRSAGLQLAQNHERTGVALRSTKIRCRRRFGRCAGRRRRPA